MSKRSAASSNCATTRARGSTILLRVPMTLTIISGLMVRAAGQYFAIPRVPCVKSCLKAAIRSGSTALAAVNSRRCAASNIPASPGIGPRSRRRRQRRCRRSRARHRPAGAGAKLCAQRRGDPRSRRAGDRACGADDYGDRPLCRYDVARQRPAGAAARRAGHARRGGDRRERGGPEPRPDGRSRGRSHGGAQCRTALVVPRYEPPCSRCPSVGDRAGRGSPGRGAVRKRGPGTGTDRRRHLPGSCRGAAGRRGDAEAPAPL